MPVTLKMHTTDPDEIRLAERYWAMNETGDYQEKVNDLLPFGEHTQSGTLAGFVRRLCTAFDQNQVCPDCNGLIEIKNRSGAKKFPRKSYQSCAVCKEAQDLKAEEIKAAKAAELKQWVSERSDYVMAPVVDYQAIADDIALLLLALLSVPMQN